MKRLQAFLTGSLAGVILAVVSIAAAGSNRKYKHGDSLQLLHDDI